MSPPRKSDYEEMLEQYLDEIDEFEEWNGEPGPSTGRPSIDRPVYVDPSAHLKVA